MVDVYQETPVGEGLWKEQVKTLLGSQIAAARVLGFQGVDLSDSLTVAACAKISRLMDLLRRGDYNTVSRRLHLHNMVLPPFKAAVKAGVKTFMNSFNDLNGIPTTGHTYLQRQVLKVIGVLMALLYLIGDL